MERIAFCRSCGQETPWSAERCPWCAAEQADAGAATRGGAGRGPRAGAARAALWLSFVAIGLGAAAVFLAVRAPEGSRPRESAAEPAAAAPSASRSEVSRVDAKPPPPANDDAAAGDAAPHAEEAASPPSPPPDARLPYLIPPEDSAHERVEITEDLAGSALWTAPWLQSARERSALRIIGQAFKDGVNPLERLGEVEDGQHLTAFRALDARFKTWDMEDAFVSLWEYGQVFPLDTARLVSVLESWQPGVLGPARAVWLELVPAMTSGDQRREWWTTKATHPPAEVLARCTAAKAPEPPGSAPPTAMEPPAGKPEPSTIDGGGTPSTPTPPKPTPPPTPPPPAEDLAAVLQAFDLRLVGLRIDYTSRAGRRYPGSRWTVADLPVQSRRSPLSQARVQEATDRLRRSLEGLDLWRLVACCVRFYDPTREPPGSDSGVSAQSMEEGGGVLSAYARSIKTEVRWYARSVTHRAKFGPWQRESQWADGNVAPEAAGVEKRVLPAPVAEETPVLYPDTEVREPLYYVAQFGTSWDAIRSMKPSFSTGAAWAVIATDAKALDLAAAKTRSAALRAFCEPWLGGLWRLRVSFVRLDRYTEGRGMSSYAPARPAVPTAPDDRDKVRDVSEVSFDGLAPLDKEVPITTAVEWYALLIEHRPLRFQVVLSGATRSDGASLRFAKAGSWKTAAWTAPENGEPPTSPGTVRLFPPQFVK